jgi:hypothetical protein
VGEPSIPQPVSASETAKSAVPVRVLFIVDPSVYEAGTTMKKVNA